MLRVRHLLLVIGLISLMSVPGLVRALTPEETCTGSWNHPTETSCGFMSGNRVTVFATSTDGGSGTVRAIEVIDGVERIVAWCSFGGGGSSQNTPSVAPSPVSIRGLVHVSPAPTQVPEVDATVSPPAVGSRTITAGGPGGCAAREIYTPLRQLACRINGSGKGIYGCSGLAN